MILKPHMNHPKLMKNSTFTGLCLGVLAFVGGGAFLKGETLPAPAFTLSSPAFTDGGALPKEYTCDGKRASPPLAWSNPPAGTRFFAVTMHHIPGPGDKHVYLVIYNIPAATRSLPENAQDIGVFGINTVNGKQEYTPPCSKGPGAKSYTMTVYALSSEAQPDVPAAAVTMDLLLAAIKDKTLATSVMNVTYDRAGTSSQQPRGGPGPRIPRELERALGDMALAPEQKQKVDAVIGGFQEKQRQLRDDLLQQLKGILTAEQYGKIEESFQRPPPPPPSQGGEPPAKPN